MEAFNQNRKMQRIYVLGILLSACIFLFDLSIELGVAGGVPYIAVVLIGLFSDKKNYFFLSAVLGTILTILGFYFSPEGGELWKVFLNRLFAIFAIIVTAVLCSKTIYDNAGWENKNKALLQGQSERQNLLVIFFGTLLFLSLGATSKILLDKIKDVTDSQLRDELEITLNSTEKVLAIWEEDRRTDIATLASDEETVNIIKSLLQNNSEGEKLSNNSKLKGLRDKLKPFIDRFSYKDFFVVSPDYINIGSMSDSSLGQVNLLTQQKGFLEDVFQGKTLFSNPIYSDIRLHDGPINRIQNYPSLFVSTPVLDPSKNIIAALIFGLDPAEGFSDIFSIGRPGISGETYPFDRHGRILAKSRFIDQIQELGLIDKSYHGILELEIRDPGGNLVNGYSPELARNDQPLTFMAKEAIQKRPGINLEGYRDYRGVPVIGVWNWNNDLNIGMTTEIDYSEAYKGYDLISKIVLYSMSVIGILLLAFSALMILSRSNAIRYAERLRENEASLIKSKETAEKASKAKSEFLARMSHELRTPMNAILGFTQLMQMNTKNKLSDTEINNLAMVISAGNHLLELINEVLDLSRIESGNIQLSMEKVDMVPIVDNVISISKALASEQSITLEYKKIPESSFFVNVDPLRFKQVVLNLVSNAIKYNKPNGSVIVSYVKQGDNMMRLEIEDTGPGVPKDKQDKLFQPFERFNVNAESIEGTGIGLTITKQLIELMNGKIGFESTEGEGCLFFVDIPISSHATAIKTEKIEDSDSSSLTNNKKKNILYIEDIPANVELARQILSLRKNICLLSASTALVGIELALSEKPDLILMDIHMPGMDGLTAFKKLQTIKEVKDIPVVALTADAMDGDIEKVLKMGFKDYITKPIDVPKFLNVIDEISK